jgi:hypothetical protein
VPALQVPATWQGSLAVQTIGLLPVQTPFWQVSVRVHALPSLHEGPVVGAQVPVAGAQVEHPVHTAPSSCHCPAPLHVCGCWPLHRLEVGAHAVHVPPLQTIGHTAPLSAHCPVASHFCG